MIQKSGRNTFETIHPYHRVIELFLVIYAVNLVRSTLIEVVKIAGWRHAQIICQMGKQITKMC